MGLRKIYHHFKLVSIFLTLLFHDKAFSQDTALFRNIDMRILAWELSSHRHCRTYKVIEQVPVYKPNGELKPNDTGYISFAYVIDTLHNDLIKVIEKRNIYIRHLGIDTLVTTYYFLDNKLVYFIDNQIYFDDDVRGIYVVNHKVVGMGCLKQGKYTYYSIDYWWNPSDLLQTEEKFLKTFRSFRNL